MDLVDLVFVLSGLLCLGSACAIVTRKNPVYSVICMLPFFIGMTILFVLLSAPFLAAMQMMVYGGAILVVFLFVIMLINLRPEELKDDFSLQAYAPPAIVGGMLGGLILSFVRHGIPAESALDRAFSLPVVPDANNPHLARSMEMLGFGGHAPALGSIESISIPMFKQYVVPFELISLLIVVAVLGAVILAKKRV
ncbi:MAG: NADH-quinone oxidoreductase subunit J [Planctomycetota bacterium]|nr:NADH-quinone oxidoreductase subunit J [Planctomycetota bacterium]